MTFYGKRQMTWFVEETYNEQNSNMKMCLLDFKVIGCFDLVVTQQ